MLHLLFLLMIVVQTKHTSYYNEWKAGNFNHDDFFQRNTYLPFSNIDPCMEINSREDYINLLKQLNIKCEGKWCINGEWKCKYHNSRDCYNREHIIDLKNSEVEFDATYDKDIAGNFIMAYGAWNQEIGRIKDWNSIKAEKSEIYGQIFNMAYNNVKQCHDKQNERIETILEYTINIITFLFILTAIVLGVYVTMNKKDDIIDDEDIVDNISDSIEI